MISMDLHLIGKVHLLMNFDLILIYFSKYLKKNSVARPLLLNQNLLI